MVFEKKQQFLTVFQQTNTEYVWVYNYNYNYILFNLQLMANTIPFKDEIYNSALKELFNTVSEKPYVMPEITER